MDQIGDHLADCESCIDRLENMEPGPIAKGLRESILSSENVEDQISSGAIIAATDLVNVPRSNHLELGFEKYELIGSIAENPFANLFMALDQKQQQVAIKIPFRAKITTPHHCQLFLYDAEAASSLNHPNVLPLLDFGYWQEDLPFAAARHLDVPNLKRFAIESTLSSAEEMRQVMLQICQAIGNGHQQNVLHRHLTPNNIFMAPGPEVLVADFCVHYDGRYHFGLQEPLQDPNPFESPEAINNDPEYIDHRNDIFAIGKILKLLLRITTDVDESKRNRFEAIQNKCTRHRRRDRYQTVTELMDAIESF